MNAVFDIVTDDDSTSSRPSKLSYVSGHLLLGIISHEVSYWPPTVGRSSGKLRRSLAISVWFGISQRSCCTHTATVVDPVGIRAISMYDKLIMLNNNHQTAYDYVKMKLHSLSTLITLGYSVHCNAISLAGGQLHFRSSTPSLATPSIPHVFNPNCIIINLFNNRFVSTVFNHVLLVPTSGFRQRASS
ncbi:hypothetical protein T07_1666 [Trichinella nelsoni]|uniref:Uncharacterized protein n=1 Tax=Trichinella nelsoni TaxID=6336 RepID=A0A0V0S5I5_9BILA|nr:hypothetical protein T07_1666 [Trichinella nelsoni]